MSDLISRAYAKQQISEWATIITKPTLLDKDATMVVLDSLPSTEAEPTVIRSKTLLPTKDFKEWAKRIKDVNPNAVVIPCDAEVASAEAVQGDGKMIPIELKKRYPHSRDEDITDAFMRGYQAHGEAVQGWIPCSEKMPDEEGEYLTTYHGKFVKNIIKVMWYKPENNCFVLYLPGAGDISYEEVIAWMPLPTPYKGGDSE